MFQKEGGREGGRRRGRLRTKKQSGQMLVALGPMILFFPSILGFARRSLPERFAAESVASGERATTWLVSGKGNREIGEGRRTRNAEKEKI